MRLDALRGLNRPAFLLHRLFGLAHLSDCDAIAFQRRQHVGAEHAARFQDGRDAPPLRFRMIRQP